MIIKLSKKFNFLYFSLYKLYFFAMFIFYSHN